MGKSALGKSIKKSCFLWDKIVFIKKKEKTVKVKSEKIKEEEIKVERKLSKLVNGWFYLMKLWRKKSSDLSSFSIIA